jgi:hypothetical protein
MADNGKFVGPCCVCKSEMWLPTPLYDAANHGRGKISFYCAYGHSQVFAEGESELDQLRRERDRARQQLAQRDDEIRTQARLIDNLKQQRDIHAAAERKLKSRASHGVCPCCNRQFVNMAKHMQSKHPNFVGKAA